MSRYDFTEVHEGLKDFQRTTVDYVFERMYVDDDPARRFLVADEVGLGKTLVARGLIARAIEHLERRGIDRIDVVYICSNADIARQNINRLNVTGRNDFSFASRVTLLAAELHNLTKNPINFVSFTPGTSFDLKGNMGMQEERMLLYWLIKKAWPDLVGTKKGPRRVFQGGVRRFDEWERRLAQYARKARRVDRGLRNRFLHALEKQSIEARAAGYPSLRERFEELASEWAHDRVERHWKERDRRNAFVGELRNLLARTCIDALEPDLIILDEFQRFKHLLETDSPAAELAHSMFNYSDGHAEARVLLLSATPYKMYTLSDESAEDDHYADFVRTIDFLMDGNSGSFRSDLRDLREAFLQVGTGKGTRLLDAKTRVEASLRRVMARTERLAVDPARNGMLRDAGNGASKVTADDLVTSVNLQHASERMGGGGVIEYWKSTPYFANFWGGYKIGRQYAKAAVEDPLLAADVRRLLRAGKELVPWQQFEQYRRFDPGNARLRTLTGDMLDADAWKLLWMPPALPYYQLGKPFRSESARRLTKRLVFSAWNAVPNAVSTILSYEAERRIMALRGRPKHPNTAEGRERYTEPLRFPKTGSGMSALSFIYPSPSLARYADPLRIARVCAAEGTEPTAETILVRAEDELMRRLRRHFPADGPTDDRWYWAAPLLLDASIPRVSEWLLRRRAYESWTGRNPKRSTSGLELHLDQARRLLRNELDLGRPPDDLGRVLALLAVGGPGNVALRAIGRITPKRQSEHADPAMRDAAAKIAWGFRSLFNTPEVTVLVRRVQRHGPYWQRALRYAVEGCLQATMDEYLHVLRGYLGILDTAADGAIGELATTVADVVSLRPADLRARDPLADGDEAERRMRSRFALPFGQHRSEETSEIRRSGFVRAAFNSPFWPFVLTTTSIGQEGLDFHLYCHAVVHWNLPANPVDLEQREGRVHRYMGHAVRKNLAAAHSDAALRGSVRDPWDGIVSAAVAARPSDVNDLVPYWVFPGEATIERHVPMLPLSREEGRLHDLRRSLALYRMVFGQPRQEELVEWLETTATDGLADQLRVDLTPRERAVDT